MRKVVAGLFVSLDGVVEAPEEWGFRYFDEEMTKRVLDGIAEADAVLLGRRTYEEFSQLWPGQGGEVPMSDFLNGSPKHVVSSRLGPDDLGWGPATIHAGDLVEEVTAFKRRPGRNIQVPGSPTLVRGLLAAGLLDELSITICPVVVGTGMRLFDGLDRIDLDVTSATSFASGVLAATYRPAVHQHTAVAPEVTGFPAAQ